MDVGSNSGRVVVLRVDRLGHLEVLADGRATLRLARDLGRSGDFSEETMQRTVEALRDFEAIARGAGVERIEAVATSAVREAGNGEEMVARIRGGSGLDVRIISGEEEARFSQLGAIRGLPVQDGVNLDVGGGSIELSRFTSRNPGRSVTLPLGALRMSDRFLSSDPPGRDEVGRLRQEVAQGLEEAELGPLEPGERLVGTGGTIRNLAKIDRRVQDYPVKLLHGYVLTRTRADQIVELLLGRRAARRRRTPGLNPDRADSIAGGAAVVQAVMHRLRADSILVSGQGLREGIALEAVGLGIASVEEVRATSVRSLAQRFSTWNEQRALDRARVAGVLFDALAPEMSARDRERLEHAAILMDVGRAIDYYRRFDHAANVVVESDLAGFSHRKLALLSAVIRQAGESGMRIRIYAPLATSADRGPVERLATILAIADEVEQRLPPGAEGAVRCEHRGKRVVLTAPLFDPYRVGVLGARFKKAFGKELLVEPSGADDA